MNRKNLPMLSLSDLQNIRHLFENDQTIYNKSQPDNEPCDEELDVLSLELMGENILKHILE